MKFSCQKSFSLVMLICMLASSLSPTIVVNAQAKTMNTPDYSQGSFSIPQLLDDVSFSNDDQKFPAFGDHVFFAGTVKDSLDTPLQNIKVCAYGQSQEACTPTDANGNFQITKNIILGENYILRAGGNSSDGGGSSNFAQEYWQESSTAVGALSLSITDGTESYTGLIFTLQEGGTISGEVTAQSTGLPLPDISVCLAEYENDLEIGCVQPDQTGHYLFTGLATDDYRVWIQGTDGVLEYYDDAHVKENAARVHVEAGFSVTAMDFSLANSEVVSGMGGTGGSVSGTVVSAADGQPLENMNVCFMEYESGDWAECAQTDGSGNYLKQDLNPADYRVEIREPNWTHEYYPNELRWDLAQRVSVSDGQETSGIDFSLQPGGTISGTVTDTSGNPLQDISVELNGPDFGDGACTGEDGVFSFDSAALDTDFRVHITADNWCGGPQNYAHQYWQNVFDWDQAALITLNLENRVVSNINFNLTPGGGISGHIYMADGVTPVEGACVNVSSTAPQWNQIAGFRTTASDGSFSFNGISVGDSYIYTDVNCSGQHPDLQDEWYANGSSTPDGNQAAPVTVLEGQNTSDVDFQLDSSQPYIAASLNQDWIRGYQFPSNTDVSINIYDSSNLLINDEPYQLTSSDDGTFELLYSSHQIDLLVGMKVQVVYPDGSLWLQIKPGSMDVVDEALDSIQGTAPANTDLMVYAGDFSQSFQMSATSDGDGNWTADFGSQGWDISHYSWAYIDLPDGEGNITTVFWNGRPQIVAIPNHNMVEVWNFKAHQDITLRVYDSSDNLIYGPVSRFLDDWGHVWLSYSETGIDLLPGVRIEAEDGITSKSLIVEPLTLDTIDRAVDLLAGTANPSETVYAFAGQDYPSAYKFSVSSDPSGNWSADFAAQGFDITEDMNFYIHIEDGDGDLTRWYEIRPSDQKQIWASITDDWVMLNNFSPDSSIQFEIKDAPEGTVLFSELISQNGFYWMDPGEHGIDLQPGMVIRALDSMTSEVKELVLGQLILTNVDYTTDVLSGTAPANTMIHAAVYFNNYSENYALDVLSDSSGYWTADFGTAGYDLLPYMIAEPNLEDEDGDHTAAQLTETPAAELMQLKLALSNPDSMDPAYAVSNDEFFLADQLFLGLVGLDDETSDVIPELAQSWTISSDGLVYDFTLRSGVQWSDGVAVTADDIRYSLLRSLELNTDNTYLLNDILNASEYSSGNVSASQVGIQVISPTQLRITLHQAQSSFLWVLTNSIARVVPQHVIETWEDAWTEPEHIVSDAAYIFAQNKGDKTLTLLKNATYYDQVNVQIEKVKIYLEDDQYARWQMYLDGQIDSVDMPLDVEYDRPLEIHTISNPCTYYYGFNLSQPPLDNLLVRKALVAAVNRQGVIDNVTHGFQTPALTFTPPGVFGALDALAEGVGIPYDPAQAQDWLAEAGYPKGVGLPPVTIWFNDSAGHREIAEYIQSNWENILGISVELRSEGWEDYLSDLETDNTFPIWRLGWCSDYPEAYNFLSDSILMNISRFGNWDASAYADVLDQARLETDPEARKLLYAQAENILVNQDVVALPVYHYTQRYASRAYLERAYTILGHSHIATWHMAITHEQFNAYAPIFIASVDGQTTISASPYMFEDAVDLFYIPTYGPAIDGKTDLRKGLELRAYKQSDSTPAVPASGRTYFLNVLYSDADVEKVNENTLFLYKFNDQTQEWDKVLNQMRNINGNEVALSTNELGTWVLFGDSILENKRVFASLNQDTIEGENFTPSGSVVVKIYQPGSSNPAWQSDEVFINQFGGFRLDLSDHSIDLIPGTKITVLDNTSLKEKSLTLASIAIEDEVDFDAGVVRGSSGPGVSLSIIASREDRTESVVAVSDSYGSWQADFSQTGLTLDLDTDFSAQITDQDGDLTTVDLTEPQELNLKQVNIALAVPSNLDPTYASDSTSAAYIEQLFIGLVDLDDETNQIIPELASSWTVSSDGMVYTFKLRTDVFWSNGVQVTAYDVKYAILRALNPDSGSLQSYVLEEIIKNACEYHQRAVGAEQVGVKVLGSGDLQITLTHPAAYFLSILTMPFARPLPQSAISVWGDEWTEPQHIVTNGAFRIKRVTDEYLLMDRSSNFYAVNDVQIDRIKYLHVDDSQVWDLYLAGELDTFDLPFAYIPDSSLDSQIHQNPTMGIYYYGFNTTQPVVNDVRVRRALSLAIDRQKLIDDVLVGNQQPARWFSAPGLVASPTLRDYPDLGVGLDIPQAQSLLQDYLSDTGQSADDLEITLMFNAGSVHQAIAEAIWDMWFENLGISVNLVSQDWETFRNTISGPAAPQIWRMGWLADYPDVKNFLQDAVASGGDVNPVSESGDPFGGLLWKNITYESLIAAAAQEQDPDVRMDLYAQTEQILTVQDAALIPIYWYAVKTAAKPYLDRHYSSAGQNDVSTWHIAAGYSLSVTVNPSQSGQVQVSPAPNAENCQYLPGTDIQLEAVPQDGFVFDDWSGDISKSENPLDIQMTTDFSLTANFHEITPPSVIKVNTVAQTADKLLSEDEQLTNINITQFLVTFSENVYNPAGDNELGDVTNSENYSLIELGPDELLDGGDDTRLSIQQVLYNASSRTATVVVNDGSPLPIGKYLFTVSGSTSIEDLAGNKLDGNSDGIGGDDFTIGFTVSLSPAAPTLMAPGAGIALSNAAPTLEWQAAQNAAEYQIQIDNSSSFSTPEVDENLSDLAFTLASTLPDGKYYWRVRGINRFGLSGTWSSTFNFTVDTTPPPASLLSSPANNSAVRGIPTFTWAATAGAVQYQFQLDKSPDFSTDPFTSAFLSERSYLPENLSPGVYYWRVRSVDAVGNWKNWDDCPYNTVTVLLFTPGSLSLQSPANGLLTSINNPVFIWDLAENAASYHIQIANDSRFYQIVQDTANLPDNSFTASILPDGKYYWHVRSLNENMEAGSWSSVWSFTVDITPPAVPVLITPEDAAFTSDTTPVLKAGSSSGAVRYNFAVWQNDEMSGEPVAVWQSSTYSMTVPSSDAWNYGTYYWAVSAQDAAGNVSQYSQTNRLDVTNQVLPNNLSFLTNVNPTFNWKSVSGSLGFVLQVSRNVDLSDPVVDAADLSSNTLSYTVNQPLETGLYYWQLAVQTSTDWLITPVWQFTVTQPPLTAPVLVSPMPGTLINVATPLFSWNTLPDVHHFEVQLDCSSMFNTINLQQESLSAGVLTWAPTALPDGLYYWRVRAVNVDGCPGLWSGAWKFTLDTISPLAPGLSSPTDKSILRGTPSLTWKTSSGAVLYQLQLDESPDFDSSLFTSPELTSRTYSLPIQLAEGSYYWRVRACDAAQNWGAWEDANVYTFNVLPIIPAAPILTLPLNNAYLNTTAPDFVWAEVAGASRYQIQVDRLSSFISTDLQDVVLDPGVVEFTASPLADGKYYWRVRALNENMEAGTWSKTWGLYVDTQAPDSPILYSPADSSFTADTTPSFKVKLVSGAVKYEFGVWKNDMLSGDPLWTASSSSGYVSLPSSSALAHGEYFWSARSVDRSQNSSSWTQPNHLVLTWQRLPADESFTLDTTPAFSWTAVPGASAYWLQVSQNSDMALLLIDKSDFSSSVRSYILPSDLSLSEGKYFWQMKYFKDGIWSAPSPVWGFTVTPPAPAAPELSLPLAGELSASNDLDFSWQPVDDAVMYHIQLDDNSRFASPLADEKLIPGAESYHHEDIPDGKYYWRVCSVNAYAAEGAWSASQTFQVDTTAPDSPLLSSPKENTSTSDTTPTLKVVPVSGASQYRFQICTQSDCSLGVLVDELHSYYMTVSFADALPYRNYFWRVLALDAAGNASDWSVSSRLEVSFLNIPAEESFLRDSTPSFTWFAIAGAQAYDLEISANADMSAPLFVREDLSSGVRGFTLPDDLTLDSGLYYWRMRALIDGAWADYSPVRTFVASADIPDAPQLASPSLSELVNDNTPQLTWNAAALGDRYRLQIDNDSRFRTPEQDVVLDTGELIFTTAELRDGKYYWRVQALNSLGASGAWSKSGYFYIDTTSPSAPRLSRPLNNSTVRGIPIFSWNAASSASYYQFQISQVSDFSDVLFTSDPLNSRTFQAPDAFLPGTYFWRVRAQDKAGNWSEWQQQYVVTILLGIPTSPLLESPLYRATINETEPTLEWSAVDFGWAYRVQISTSSSFRTLVEDVMLDPGQFEFTASSLQDGRYYWRVVAYNANVEIGGWSRASYFTVDTLPPNPPLLYAPTDNAVVRGSPLFSWSSTSGAAAYQLQIDDAFDFSSPLTSDPMTARSFQFSTPLDQGVYYWRVRAQDVAGNWSAWQTYRTINLLPAIPAAPMLASPANAATILGSETELQWQVVDFAAAYQIQIDTASSFSNPLQETSVGADTLTYNVSSLPAGKVYWRIRAVNENNEADSWSSFRYFYVK